MSRYPNKPHRKAAAWAIALSAFSISCGIIDLRPVKITTYPSAEYAVLPSRDTPLSVTFSGEPVIIEAEGAFSVQSDAGIVEGDFDWDGAGFTWRPVAEWDPGVRYRLILSGAIRMADGREARPEIDLPFYVLRDSRRPMLASYDPPQGASIGAERPDRRHPALLGRDGQSQRRRRVQHTILLRLRFFLGGRRDGGIRGGGRGP